MATGRLDITGLCHTVVCVGLGAALALLFGADVVRDSSVPPALDATAQRLRMQDELVTLNGKMDELIRLLQSGNVKVVCLPADTDVRGPDHATRTRDPNTAPSSGAASPGGYAR